MTKKRFITWILACVALVIVAIPTIPHHHHSNMLGICMNVDDDVMGLDEICYCAVECKHSTNSTADKEDCNGKGCPASMHAIKAGTNQVQFEQNTLQLFNLNISEFVIVFLSSKSEIMSLDAPYLNNYYTTPLPISRVGELHLYKCIKLFVRDLSFKQIKYNLLNVYSLSNSYLSFIKN